MKVALAQINPTVADLEGNVERILAAIETAQRQGASLVICPEMAVPGYPPRDILFDPTFVDAVFEASADLACRASKGPPVIVGSLIRANHRPPGHPGLYNAALLLSDGRPQLVAAKRLLPAYDVFFEPRWFLPGPALPPVTIAGKRIGVLVCEDLWDSGYQIQPGSELIAKGAELLVCISASPYHPQVMEERLFHARQQPCSLIYLNQCGGNDELIFDGRSFAMNRKGELVAQLAGFEAEIRLIDLDKARPIAPPAPSPEAEHFQALVLGVRDFARKNRLERAFLGLSGGVDSAVTAVIAAEALGSDRVTAVTIPSRFTDPRSTASARELARTLGIEIRSVNLESLHAAAEETLGDLLEVGTAAENVQARLRALILMSFVNRYGGMLLNTSNKTELALGYATIYGDMAGTLCPIADLIKPQVVALAHWINTDGQVIPQFILDRPPSAELRADQVDPFDYPQLAPAVEQVVQENHTNQALQRSEHKRWQMGVILKVSQKAFGTGRMMPITRR